MQRRFWRAHRWRSCWQLRLDARRLRARWASSRARRPSRKPTSSTQQQDYKKAAERYEEAVAADPELSVRVLLPGQQLRQPLQAAAARARPENDALPDQGDRELQEVPRDKETGPDAAEALALEFLVAAYGPDKMNDPTQAGADRQAA
ncbi:MAG: hypothetical protein M0C28_13280 [Candidatus Moduliflexus flocculans]|nr:hypothetical protein [Candidatus Moduliflexus flocculans]